MPTRPTVLHVWVGSPRACWPPESAKPPEKPGCAALTAATHFTATSDKPSSFNSPVQRRYSQLGATLNNIYMGDGMTFLDHLNGTRRSDLSATLLEESIGFRLRSNQECQFATVRFFR